MEHTSIDTPQHPSPRATPDRTPQDISPSLLLGKHSSQENGLNGSVYLSEVVEHRSHLLLPKLGYILLLLALFDYIHILIPSHFTNPAWELQTIGALVEHIPIPLLGLMFVFYRHQGYMFKLERHLLGCLSWFCLVAGLLYLLMLPLGFADTWRLYHANKIQVTARLSQQQQLFQQVKGQLKQAKTDQQIEQVVTSLTPLAKKDITDPQAFKDQFLAQIARGEWSAKVQADSTWTNQSQMLLKNSLKWNLGALVAGTFLIWIWHQSDWARTREY